MQYLNEIAPKSKVIFQTMGISEEFFEKINKKEARDKLGLDANAKYVLFLDRIKTTKGLKELLDSVKGLNLHLLLIGEGPDYNNYLEYAKKMV